MKLPKKEVLEKHFEGNPNGKHTLLVLERNIQKIERGNLCLEGISGCGGLIETCYHAAEISREAGLPRLATQYIERAQKYAKQVLDYGIETGRIPGPGTVRYARDFDSSKTDESLREVSDVIPKYRYIAGYTGIPSLGRLFECYQDVIRMALGAREQARTNLAEQGKEIKRLKEVVEDLCELIDVE
jgi:hypothetical protein